MFDTYISNSGELWTHPRDEEHYWVASDLKPFTFTLDLSYIPRNVFVVIGRSCR